MLRRFFGQIRTRLLLVNLVVLLVPIAGLEFARIYERQLLGALERDMKNQAVLVREVVRRGLGKDAKSPWRQHEALLKAAARQTRTRVRLLDRNGDVVADSHRDGPPEGPEPRVRRVIPLPFDSDQRASRGPQWTTVSIRREVRSALAGKPDSHTRVRARNPSVILFLAEPIRFDGKVCGVVYITRSTQPVLLELRRIRTGLIKVLAIALAFTVLVTLLLALSISAPLSRLARAARRISKGDRDVEVPIEGSGEVRELGLAFSTMTEKLDARMRYISELSADVAHEFKSPLTSIRGAAELLGEGAADDPEARARFLSNIGLDADRLERLVTRLLELSRIEAATEPLVELDLEALIARVVDRTHSAEQPVEASVLEEPLVLRGREADLERALLNLVENALRFSPPDAPVHIEAKKTNGEIHLSVSDQGPGVPEAHRQRIFERFFTTDAERSGTGLGLAIVRSVAECHGGRIDLNSNESGATFSLVLPC